MTPPLPGQLVAARAHHPVLEVSLCRDPPLAARPDPHLQAFARAYAPSAFVDVGTACPLHCIYCSVDRGADDRTVRMEAREHLYQRLADVEAAGVRKVTLIGGEPVARPDLLHLVDVARALGIPEVMLASKSVKLARRDYVEELRAHGVSMLHLSLDSFDPAVLARLLASPSAPRQLLAALDTLLEAGMPVFLFQVLTRLNALALPAYVRQVAALQQRWRVRLPVVLTPVKLQARARARRDALALPLPEVAALLAPALALARELDVSVAHKGVPPCLLPGYRDHALEAYLVEGWFDRDDGRPLRDVAPQRLDFGPQCRDCAALAACPGVDPAYAAWRGWDEFHPYNR